MDDLTNQRVNEQMAIMRLQMNSALYADGPVYKRSRLQRIRSSLSRFKERASDAWLVLTGKAYIGD